MSVQQLQAKHDAAYVSADMAFLQVVEVQKVPRFLSVSADDGVFWSYMACQNMAAGPGHRTSLRDSMRACAVVGSHHRLLYPQ